MPLPLVDASTACTERWNGKILSFTSDVPSEMDVIIVPLNSPQPAMITHSKPKPRYRRWITDIFLMPYQPLLPALDRPGI
jgi:hypothetical protein